MVTPMLLSDFDYPLPEELIAREPPRQRDAARMLRAPRAEGALEHIAFSALPSFLRPGDLLVLNDARVIRARLRGHKVATGGEVEILLDRPAEAGRWYALGNSSKGFRPGQELEIAGARVEVAQVDAELGRLVLDFRGSDPLALAETRGELPLPPYLERPATSEDDERYQTTFARESGAVAAPTAGLHFTPEVLAQVSQSGVQVQFLTLLVGPGTFLPIRVEDLSAHRMLEERYVVAEPLARAFHETRAAKGRVIAVGTTVVRALESAIDGDGRLRVGPRTTDLFIQPGQPGHVFRAVDGLLTNFHLPKSSLLVLVAAFAGLPRVREVYAEAVSRRYRFFSYGDCCLFL
jgi:S-adenosylmethionine:tRNA ribosyltransferase-isomerase